MKIIRNHSAIATMVLAIGIGGFSARRAAAELATSVQKSFASPREAVDALKAALAVHDKAALRDIFGPDFMELLTGDDAQDRANSKKFAKSIDEGAHPLSEGDNKVVLEIGARVWPFPIPLVKENAAWRFDTAAGKQEIIDRHVGKDEFHAIGACEAFVAAQKQYITGGRGSSGSIDYAQRFKSNPGKMDGLYWKTEFSQVPSPWGRKMADAGVDGDNPPAPKPYHGYFFRIMVAQGAAAPGGAMTYMKDGHLSGGFALVAYPEHWGRSGIMTFIVNRGGVVYQRDLGINSSQLAATMTEYDPSGDWTAVKDHGVLEN